MNSMNECVNDGKSFENLFYGMWNANIINLTAYGNLEIYQITLFMTFF